MYAEFFGLRELPFNNTPDPRFFYSTPDHEEAVASLIYAVQQRKGFVLLTGEVGAGKTLVSRMMLRKFGNSIAFATINHAIESASDLLEALCTELELPVQPDLSHTQMIRNLHDFLLAKFSQNVPVVLVLDEAQNLPIAAFEQLRMIGNLEADDAKLLQIAILGQPELQRLFESAELRQLKQRVFRSFHIPALNRKATEGYIRYRLSVAGSRSTDLFFPDAIDRIHEYSRGLPRLINALCDNAMLSAYSTGMREIDLPILDSVIAQMMGPTAGTDRRAAALSPVLPARPLRTPRAPSAPGFTPRMESAWHVEAPATFVASPRVAPPRAATRPTVAAPPPAARRVVGPRTTVDPGWGSLHQFRAKLEDLGLRIASLETSGRTEKEQSAAVESTLASLKTTIQYAESTMGRFDAATSELQRREEKLRALADSVRAVGKHVAGLIQRVERTSEKLSSDDRHASQTLDRVTTQTLRARRVLDVLSRALHAEIPSVSGRNETANPVAQTPTSSSGGKILASAAKPLVAALGYERRADVLTSARNSIAGLRRAARATPPLHPPASSEAAPPSAGASANDDPTIGQLERELSDLLAEAASSAGPVVAREKSIGVGT